MYTPRAFELNDVDAQKRIIEANPLGTLVAHGPGGLTATHLPFVLEGSAMPGLRLHAHISRNNLEFAELPSGSSVLAIFRGPNAYVSPSWYPSKAANQGKAVPTWNYVSVHVHGTLKQVDDPAWLMRHLEAQTLKHEGNRSQPWSMNDAPPEYIDAMVKQIVGLEITVERIEAKAKLSQNRPIEDQQGVLAALSEGPVTDMASAMSHAVARLIANRQL
jgi:transcriptional regulator